MYIPKNNNYLVCGMQIHMRITVMGGREATREGMGDSEQVHGDNVQEYKHQHHGKHTIGY